MRTIRKIHSVIATPTIDFPAQKVFSPLSVRKFAAFDIAVRTFKQFLTDDRLVVVGDNYPFAPVFFTNVSYFLPRQQHFYR